MRPRPCAGSRPGRSSRSPARRSRTAWPSCGRSSTRSTRGCSAAASGSAAVSPRRSSATATPTPPARLRRLTQPFVLRRSKADRTARPRPARQDRADRVGRPHPRAGGAVPARRRPAARRRRRPRTACSRRGLVLAALTRLKQICNHPAHALGDGSRLGGRSGKLARFDELVDELLDVGERALVFTQFRADGRVAASPPAASASACTPRSSTAASTARGRDEMVAAFQDGTAPPVLLVSLKAGGTGLNLTAASQVIHYDRWWNPAVEDQATDRAWRIGQGRTVMVHKLVCEGTVEERIGAAHRREAGAGRRRRGQRRGVAVRAVDGRAARARYGSTGPACREPAARAFGAHPPGRLAGTMLRVARRRAVGPGPVQPGQGLRPRRCGGRHRRRGRQRAGRGAGLALRAVRRRAPRAAGAPARASRRASGFGARAPSCSCPSAASWSPCARAPTTRWRASTPSPPCSCWPTRSRSNPIVLVRWRSGAGRPRPGEVIGPASDPLAGLLPAPAASGSARVVALARCRWAPATTTWRRSSSPPWPPSPLTRTPPSVRHPSVRVGGPARVRSTLTAPARAASGRAAYGRTRGAGRCDAGVPSDRRRLAGESTGGSRGLLGALVVSPTDRAVRGGAGRHRS